MVTLECVAWMLHPDDNLTCPESWEAHDVHEEYDVMDNLTNVNV